ncbi:ureidoglycolate lyase [Mycolicibacterium sp. XJ870]
MSSVVSTRQILIQTLAEEAFAPFGAVLSAVPDGEAPRPGERLLDLSRGRPRFYVMALQNRPARFTSLTRHRSVTQTLAAVGGGEWMIAVAPPGAVDKSEARPAIEQVAVFRVPGHVAVLLHRGTWHAGPFFEGDAMSFFNLELEDTNEVDHQNYSFEGVEFVAVAEPRP